MRQMSAKSRRAVAIVTVLFLLVAGVLAALYLTNRRDVTTSSAAAYQAYQEGLENFRRYYFKEAQVGFARALALDPNFAMAMLRLAGLSNRDQAASLIERAGRLRGRLTARERLFVDMANAEIQRNVEERNKIARAIFEKYPDDVDAAMVMSGIAMSQGHAEKALEIYSGLLAANPNNAGVYNQIGYYYAWRGEYDKAMESLKKYQFMAPDQANPYDSLGEVQAYSGHYDEAIANLNKALSLKPDFFDSIGHLGVAYEGKGDYGRAIENYMKAAKVTSIENRRSGFLGQAFRVAYFAGDVPAARRIVQQIENLPRDKQDEVHREIPGIVLDLMEGKPADAERRLTEIRPKLEAMFEKEKRDPGSKPYFPEWDLLMAAASAKQGRNDEAIALCEELINPPRPWDSFEGRLWVYEGRAILAGLLARKGDLDRAEKLLAENHKWNPSWAPMRPYELVVEQARREKVLAASAAPPKPG